MRPRLVCVFDQTDGRALKPLPYDKSNGFVEGVERLDTVFSSADCCI